MLPSESVARVAVENCAYSFDELFSFLIPEELSELAVPGVRVLVPFGRGNTKRQGFILSIETGTGTEGLKYLSQVLDDEPLLNDELISLSLWLRETCFCTYFTAAKALLPGGMCMKTEKAYRICENVPTGGFSETEEERVLSFLSTKNEFVRERDIIKKCGLKVPTEILTSLEKHGWIESDKKVFSGTKRITVQKLRLTEKYLSDENDGIFTDKQKKVIAYLRQNTDAVSKEIEYYTGVSSSVIKRLSGMGVFVTFEETVYRKPVVGTDGKKEKNELSPNQRKAFDILYKAYTEEKFQTALLFGVTGSGKTSVYLELIDKVIADGKTALVLVPEISLTPQTVNLFSQRYADSVAVLHSALSAGERFDEWNRIHNGNAKVVVGTRSAVFAPLKNIGAVIIDEEQEHTYKSEMSPRYNAKDAARFRCARHNALLVLASATPSVETYAKAAAGKYILCELTERYGKAVLPDVRTVDMTDKSLLNSFSALSTPLAEEISKNLEAKEQSILLINRRGYNTFVVCKACKKVVTCPKCSISLTYHSANNRLMCHYCGYSAEFTDICPECGEHNIRYSGFGTQRIEQELKIKFPSARILRMDADTTTAKNSHDKAFGAFAAGEYDIMLGTQMVAKGLDFPNVTLVGVTSADNELYNDDFRSNERTFDLITQVVGRAGRGDKKGRAVIQTVSPESNILYIASRQDYKTFFRQEMSMRKAMIYPPFCDICVIGFSSVYETLTKECAVAFFENLKKSAQKHSSEHMIVLGPLAPRVARINNCYRQRIIIKCKNSSEFRNMISVLLKQTAEEKKYKAVSVFADMNPENADI